MNYVIVGNGDYAKMMARYLKMTKDIEVAGYVVEQAYIQDSMIDNTPVITPIDLCRDYDSSSCELVMGIGYRNMNQIKEREFLRYKELGYHFYNYIHPTAIIEQNVVIGEGNNIFEGVILQEGVSIGNANLIYGGVLVAHESRIGNYNSLSVKSCVAGCTRIGNNCFIGANATVRDHVAIADYTLVSAGTYVDKTSSAYDVIVTSKSTTLDGKKSTEFI